VPAVLITFEGGDGSGKSTQAKLLNAFLREKGYNVFFTHEPGGTAYGEKIRTILLDAPKSEGFDLDARAQVLGFCSARAQLVAEKIIPHLKKKNFVVICDRYADSTIAYQVYGGNLLEFREEVEEILSFATRKLKPDLTIFLDVTLEESLRRREGRIKDQEEPHEYFNGQQLTFIDSNHFDEQTKQFHESVKQGYEWLIEKEPSRWMRIDANRPIAVVAEEINAKVLAWLETQNVRPKMRDSSTAKKDDEISGPSLF